MRIVLRLLMIIVPLETLIHWALNTLFKGQPFGFSELHDPLIDAILLSILSFYPIKKFIVERLQLKESVQVKSALDAGAIVSKTDKNGRIVFVNDIFCQVSGYSKDEIIGKDHRILNSGFHDKQFFKNMWKTLQSNKVWKGEICNKNKNGTLYWVHSTIIPCDDGYISVRFDITDRKRIEEELRIKTERKKAIMKSSRFAIITTDTGGLVTAFNEEAERILKYSANEVVGAVTPAIWHDIGEVINKSVELGIEPGFKTFIHKASQGLYDENQWTYIAKDGTRTQVMLNITALYDASGKINGYMGIAKDLTEKIKQDEMLEAQRVRLISASKMASLGEVAAGIAHEVNNPLAIIVGKSNLLLTALNKGNNVPLDKLKDSLEKIVTSSNRASKIITSLKNLSRNATSDEKIIFKFNQAIDESLTLFDEKIALNGIKCIKSNKIDFEVFGRQTEIMQVVNNLIGNAIDAIEKEEDKWIYIAVKKENGFYKLIVTDSGPGIPDNVKDKLMQPFFTTKEVGKGTGLGLSISKQIAESHGGSLTLDSLAQNTTFVLSLPIYKKQEAA